MILLAFRIVLRIDPDLSSNLIRDRKRLFPPPEIAAFPARESLSELRATSDERVREFRRGIRGRCGNRFSASGKRENPGSLARRSAAFFSRRRTHVRTRRCTCGQTDGANGRVIHVYIGRRCARAIGYPNITSRND